MWGRRLFVLAAGLLVALAAVPAEAQVFVFHLSGDQEVPPTPSPARGGCRAELTGSDLSFACSHDVVGATTVHVHRGAAGVNGPIAFDLGDPASPLTATWTGMTPADVTQLLAGGLYLNVHTAGRPEGEIRGQIVSRTFDMLTFPLDGDQQVPPDGSSATGSCSVDLDGPAASLDVQCTHDVANPTDAHIHNAPFGENGPVIHAFASSASPFAENVPLSPTEVGELVAGFLYVNIHSVDSVTGEIRGQIADLPAAPTTGEIRIVKRTFPGGGTGFGFTDDVPGSLGTFMLDDGQTEIFAAVPAGTYTFTEDDPTTAGYALADVACSDAGGDSVGNRFARTATVALAAGEVVVCTFENQELAAGTPFVFHLSGDQEAPPLPNVATGGCMATFDAGAAELTIVCVHDVVGPTLIHVHRGAPGVNGPVVFDLGDPESPVLATWSGMSPADVADLLAGNLYVNIHTSGRPEGAIRGQIVPRSRDGFDFPMSGDQQVPPIESLASGRCFADLSDAADELTVECTHDVADATAAHVHQGPAGTNGPIRFHSPDAASPFTLVSPMAPRDVADLMAGFLYVNVHSTALPDGAIRGQIVDQPAQLVTEVPTLGEWGMVLLALALALLGVGKLAVRR
jgi:hypothetical protein